jgi:subtilisin family serine protease
MDRWNRDEARRLEQASRRRRSGAGVALCIALACATSQAQDGACLLDLAFDAPTVAPVLRELPDGRTVLAGEALIVLESGAHRAGVQERLEGLGMVVLGSIPTLGVHRIGLPPSQDDDVSLGRLRRIPGVESAEWHGLTQLAEDPANPDDTWFDQQWHHTVPDFTGATTSENSGGIATQVAWQLTHGSADVIVAVLDTGTDFAHPELAGRLLPGYDFVDEDDDPSVGKLHGVRVALVLAANGDDAFGTVGVDQACRLLPVRVS